MREYRRVKVNWLKVREQARKSFLLGELRSLGESLKVRQLQPVWCDTEGYLIVGERRWRGAELVRLEELDAVVTDEKLTPAEIQVIQLTENLHRSDLTPHEKWQGCLELLKLNRGWQAKDLASHLKLDPSMVTRLLSPSKCIPAVQEAFAAGVLGVTDCYAISKAECERDQHEMLAAKLNGSSRDELERTVQRKRSESPTVRVGRVSVPLPSGVSVVVIGDDLGFDELLTACSEVVKEGRKAQGQNLDVKTWARVMADKAKGSKP